MKKSKKVNEISNLDFIKKTENGGPASAPVRSSATSQNKKRKKRNHGLKHLFVFFGIGLAVAAMIAFLLSPVFYIKEIMIQNNQKVSIEEIISLSQLEIGQNIFLKTKNTIAKNIKENAYIDAVKIKKRLPGSVEIYIEEREPKFQIEREAEFLYLSNQGYVLEVSQTKLEIPILVGIEDFEKLKLGDRLKEFDLKRLTNVLMILESANSNELQNVISKIEMHGVADYRIHLESEGKVVYLGDASKIGTRMWYLKAILEQEKGNQGTIFIDGDVEQKNPYFAPEEG